MRSIERLAREFGSETNSRSRSANFPNRCPISRSSPGNPRDYSEHPTSALLVVEISDSTLKYDRRQKGSLYAMSGLAEYWIVNLVDHQLEVYQSPVPDSAAPYGWRYASATMHDETAMVAVGAGTIHIADLLP